MGRHAQLFIAVLSVSVVASFALAAWSFASSHSQSCSSRNTTLDVLRDVIVIATTPPPNDQLSDAQRKRLHGFRSTVFTRINHARC